MSQLENPVATNPHRLLTVEDVATLLRVPESWVYDRTRRGAIPLNRVGKYVRFDFTDIQAWYRAGCPERWDAGDIGQPAQ